MPLILIEAKNEQAVIINTDQIIVATMNNGQASILLREGNVVNTEHRSIEALMRELDSASGPMPI